MRDPAGNLYGTTYEGAVSGTVYKVDSAGIETVLYAFTGGTDGNTPVSGLVRDADGSLYGTTFGGGNLSYCGGQGCGVVFKLDQTGNETVLYSFTGPDGANPYGNLLRDSAGNLYGTTLSGGPSNAGVVFRVDPMGNETVLYAFTGGADGAKPYAGLVRDQAGNLFGTTGQGGLNGCSGGCGVVFKVDPAGKETVLYSFTGGTDGWMPYGSLVEDPQGNLYGTTFFGGDQGEFCGGYCGVVFKVNQTGKETVLYTFAGLADGANPEAGLLRDTQGNLYGTTSEGGDDSCNAPYGCGVVFKLSACSTARCQAQ